MMRLEGNERNKKNRTKLEENQNGKVLLKA
jgi:hypothetical protein